jgi:hypothetical protein
MVMGSSDLSFILDKCIQELQAGRDLDEILARYPNYARELRPLLEMAAWTKNARAGIQVPVDAQSLSRKAFTRKNFDRKLQPAVRRFNLRLAFSLTAIILCLVIALFATTVASAQALPGDALYPVKLALEQVQVNLTSGTAQRLRLQQSFDQQRVTEVSRLITLGRTSNVTFFGLLVGSNDSWNVAGINLNVPDQQASKLPTLQNTVVQVTGETEGKAVIVAEIEPHLVTFDGQIQQLNSDQLQVSGVNVSLDQNTDIDGELSVNQQVQITAKEQDDGELVAVAVNGKQTTTPTPTNPAQPTTGETPSTEKAGSQEKAPQPTEQEAPMPTSGIQPLSASPTPGGENEGGDKGSSNGSWPATPTPTPGSSYHSEYDGENRSTLTPTPTPTPSSENGRLTPTTYPTEN